MEMRSLPIDPLTPITHCEFVKQSCYAVREIRADKFFADPSQESIAGNATPEWLGKREKTISCDYFLELSPGRRGADEIAPNYGSAFQ
jgi:hypothetical protein